MNKAVASACLVVLLFFSPLSAAVAGETKYRYDPVTQTSRAVEFKTTWAGYKIFRKSCKNCHHRGNSVGAPFLHTESKNIRGWNRVFLTKYPKCAKAGDWAALSQEDLLNLHDYLYDTAADTYDPNDAKSCG